MAQNYAKKWDKSIDQIYTQNSYVKAHFGTNGISFKDAQTVIIDTLETFAPVNYVETAIDNAYGTPKMASNSQKEYTIAHNKAVSIRVPATLIMDTPTVTGASYTKAELEEQFIPEYDAYALGKISASVPAANDITYTSGTDDAYKKFLNLVSLTTNKRVPRNSLIFFCTAAFADDVRSLIQKFNDQDGAKIKNSAALGTLGKVPVVEVPDDIMPDKVIGVLASKKSVFAPVKVDQVKIFEKVLDFDGIAINIRQRNDVFVFSKKVDGLAQLKTL